MGWILSKQDIAGHLEFYPNVDQSTECHRIGHSNLRKNFDRLANVDPKNPHKINFIYILQPSWTTPFPSKDPHMHVYVGIDAQDGWTYSIDTAQPKNIIVQRGKNFESVTHFLRGRHRSFPSDSATYTPTCIIEAKGKGSVRKVMKYIYERNLLNIGFSRLEDHSQPIFAKLIFDQFNSEGKKLDISGQADLNDEETDLD